MAPRLLSTAFLTLVLTACSSSAPTGPGGPAIPVAANYEGVWTITYTVAECGGFRQCVHYRGDSRTIHLHVTPVAGGYEGVVQLESHVQVSVTGSVGTDGRLTLQGIRRAALADDYEIEIESLTLPANGAPDVGQPGAIGFATRGRANSWINGNALTTGPITVAEFTAPLGGAMFSGKWTGNFPGNNCVAQGWTHCYPFWDDTTYPLTFELSQAGGSVSGTVKMSGSTIPVSGVVAGDTVTFAGTSSPASSGVDVTYRVETDGVRLDKVGRLTGTLRLVATWAWHDGRGTWTVSYPAIPLHSVARSLR